MADDSGLITMEAADGTAAPLPAELTQTPEPTPEPAPEPPPEPAPTPEPAPEPQSSPHRMVPLGELIEERTARKALEAEARAGRDLAAAVRAHPELIPILTGQGPQAPPAPPDTSDLEAFARDLSLVTIEGKPDIEAAGRILARQAGLIERRARQIAEEAVGPIRQERLSEKANAQKVEALRACEQLKIPTAYATQILDSLPPSMLADPMAVATSILVAAGQQFIGQQQAGAQPPAAPQTPAPTTPQTPPSPPVFTEGSGGRSQPAGLSTVELQAAKRAGVKPKDFETFAGKLNTGAVRPKFYVMEDD